MPSSVKPAPSTTELPPKEEEKKEKKKSVLRSAGPEPEPDRDGWSHYTGKWWSTKYVMPVVGKSLGCGTAYVQLPDSEIKDPISVKADISYTGLYRYGAREKIEVTMEGDGATANQEYVSPPTTVQGQKAPHGPGKLAFKIEKREGDKITGSYTLTHPKDAGKFELQKGLKY